MDNLFEEIEKKIVPLLDCDGAAGDGEGGPSGFGFDPGGGLGGFGGPGPSGPGGR